MVVPCVWQLPHTAAWLCACRLASAQSLQLFWQRGGELSFAIRTQRPSRPSPVHALYSHGFHCSFYMPHAALCLSQQQPAQAGNMQQRQRLCIFVLYRRLRACVCVCECVLRQVAFAGLGLSLLCQRALVFGLFPAMDSSNGRQIVRELWGSHMQCRQLSSTEPACCCSCCVSYPQGVLFFSIRVGRHADAASTFLWAAAVGCRSQ
jgi:hypothetical protein